MKSNIATSDKSKENPLIVNGKIVAYLPLEIEDKPIPSLNINNQNKPLFSFEGMVFRMTRVDNTDAVINFYPKEKETTGPYCLMKALVAYLKQTGGRNNELLQTTVPSSFIQEYIRKNFRDTVIDDFSYWMKSAKGNLKKKIPVEYKNLIFLGDYSRKSEGYFFALRLSF